MKFIIPMQNRFNALKTAAFDCVKKKEGQNTIEYITMLGVVVGIALLVGTLVKNMMPELFDNIKQKIVGGINSSN